MNKAELVEAVAKTLGAASRAEAERAVTAVVDGIKSGIRKDKTVQLVGFGTFKVSERAARMGVNPKTGAKDQDQEVEDREIRSRQGIEGEAVIPLFCPSRNAVSPSAKRGFSFSVPALLRNKFTNKDLSPPNFRF